MSLFVAIIENINMFLIRPLYLCFHLTFHYKVVINYCGYHFHPFTMTFLGCVHPSIHPTSEPPLSLVPDGENNQSERSRRRPTTIEEILCSIRCSFRVTVSFRT